jgi:hypothetical protein
MPPNKPQTLLSLEAFRSVIGWMPYLFYQLVNDKIPLTDSADLIVCEYPWQRPMAMSRSDDRRAINVAEQKLQTFLGYDVSTRYRSEGYPVGYLKQLPRASAYGNWGGYYGGGYGSALLTLNVGKLQRIATVSYTKLADIAVTLSDEDSDKLADTFTATFADSTSDPASVIVAFSAADQPNSYGTDASSNPLDWQVRPATVTRLNPTTLQVTGPAWLLVKPVLYERAGPSAGYNSSQTGISSSGTFDPDTATNFVSGLTAWLKVYSLENQVTFVRRFGGTETTEQVAATIVDAELGQVQINLGGCSTYPGAWCGPGPVSEEIRINYEAGATKEFKQAQYLQYQTDWDTVVARFAIAELAQAPAATAKQNPVLAYWREDLAHVGSMQGGGGDSYRISNDVLGNPFRNTRRGAVEAWLAVQSLGLIRAVNL